MYRHKVPYVTTTQMIAVDRARVQDFGIALIQMMENAGRHLARGRCGAGDLLGQRVIVLAGTGGNGGGAPVAARRLHHWGAQVQVFIPCPAAHFRAVPAQQLAILQRMQVRIATAEARAPAGSPAVIIDGIIGYSLQGAPQGGSADLIRWAHAQPAPILALDGPAGLDATTGIAVDPTIKAAATMTLALPKAGLRAPGAGAYVGELYLADIGVPPALYAAPGLGLTVPPLFAGSDILRLR